MTTVAPITQEQVFNRLLMQLPPWFANPQFVPLPTGSIKNPSTNFNNVTWAFLITAFNSYLQFQYDWLQLRIGAFEIAQDPNWPNNINLPAKFPFVPGN